MVTEMAWAPPSKPGDRAQSVADAKIKLRRYSYGKGLGTTDEYTVEFGVALVQFQVRRNEQILRGAVTGMPGMNTFGVLDWATKKNLGILAEQLAPPRDPVPVVFTINGHLGGLFDGPAYHTARPLEVEGAVRVQPVGYVNWVIPFDNASGIHEINRLVNDPLVLPPGTPWAVASHSQGAIVFSAWYRETVAPHQHRWPYDHFRGGVQYGNPMRPRSVVATWVADPPAHGTEGLAHDCLAAQIPGVEEVSRRGDLYADKRPDAAGEHKTAVYRAIQGDLVGRDSLTEQLGELATNFGPEVFAVFQAIIGGVQFLFDMNPHNVFDLRPGTDHLRRILNIQ